MSESDLPNPLPHEALPSPSAAEDDAHEVEDAELLDGEEIEPERLARVIKATVERYSGPLPHPSVLAGYKDVDPECVTWILARAAEEQSHRHWLDREPLRQSARGQWLAFTIAVLVILAGALLIYLDKPIVGLIAILTPLAALIGVFIYREIAVRKERENEQNHQN